MELVMAAGAALGNALSGAWSYSAAFTATRCMAVVAVALLCHTLWRRRRRTNGDAPVDVDSLTDRVLQRLNTQCDDAVTFARADSQSWRTKYERALSERDEWREKVADLSALLAKVGQMKQATAGGDSGDSHEDGDHNS